MPAAHPVFPHLFRPLQIKGLTLRNRVAVSAHFAGWWVDKGLPSDEFVAYVKERAKGGIGLFVIGATTPTPSSGWMENVDEAIIPRYRALAEAGHRHGTAVFAQLIHPGYRPLPGRPIIASRPAAEGTQPHYRDKDRPLLPTVQDLHHLVEAFGAAAGRAAAGGVDGLELHSHESFMHAQMLNPLWNTRTDAYGGSLENRMRFMVETLQAMRAAIGPDMPLGVRLKLDDMEQRGMSLEDYIEAVQRLEALELVDYINFTGGDGRLHHGPMPRPEGEWLPLVKEMRAHTKLILMHAGRIATPEMAEQALAEGALDVVCMTKTHIADPHFTQKVYENRLEDIRYCTRCLQSCHGKMHLMTCVYNPVTSRETTWAELQPAAKRRRVVVVGAGPAGMECALTAALRGHEVLVLEKTDRVGGQVWLGAASPLRKPWARIAEF
ncbi:MAG TPA: FAD-dependent oxidoreductase, partial [Chthonomonadaceae bacterium]|nr:FAD-dependent oxidoreductase [Chthonomonadaceae bacterium]